MVWTSKIKRFFCRRSYLKISVWFILFLQVFFYLGTFADIVRHDYHYEADFSIVNDGRNFDEIIMGANDVSLKECQLECVKHLKCKSVNYNKNERKCELCDSDFDEDEALVDEMRKWKNYGTPSKQDGGFSQWIYSKCSVTCGIGQGTRHRHCNKPEPRFGGAVCVGPYLETLSCNLTKCPFDGGFSDWSVFGTCSVTCGNGTQMRNRSCDNPLPSHGGKNCSKLGNATEYKNCIKTPCPVHGGFSNWSVFGTCSVTCGNGTQMRNRSCDNPLPSHGGRDCSRLGNATDYLNCTKGPCPDCLKKDHRYSGKALKEFYRTTSWKKCSSLCGIYPGCLYWTWVENQPDRICYVKEDGGIYDPLKGAFAGPLGCAINKKFSISSYQYKDDSIGVLRKKDEIYWLKLVKPKMLFRKIDPGLDGTPKSLSFESVSKDGYYLACCGKHGGYYYVILSQQKSGLNFDWFIRYDTFYPGTVAFETASTTHKSKLMEVHSKFLRVSHITDSSEINDKKAASFKIND